MTPTPISPNPPEPEWTLTVTLTWEPGQYLGVDRGHGQVQPVCCADDVQAAVESGVDVLDKSAGLGAAAN